MNETFLSLMSVYASAVDGTSIGLTNRPFSPDVLRLQPALIQASAVDDSIGLTNRPFWPDVLRFQPLTIL